MHPWWTLLLYTLKEKRYNGLCWHCDEPWSHEHYCKKGRLLMIEPVDKEDLEHEEEDCCHEEEDTEEESQPADCMMHALTGYANSQTIRVSGLLKQQPITFLIDTGSTNNFMNSKVAARMTLYIEDCSKFDVKVVNGRILKFDRRSHG
ncbi:hypothetical protein GW17_00037366 [Ensete ventricosum]|nr:hypothetical protein GW17_00037366 [Ensete ventricosum]RZR93741.1 hypothetical protein BHM03_00022309 [Ensete ventricosum]